MQKEIVKSLLEMLLNPNLMAKVREIEGNSTREKIEHLATAIQIQELMAYRKLGFEEAYQEFISRRDTKEEENE